MVTGGKGAGQDFIEAHHLPSLNQGLHPIIGTKPTCAVSELRDLNGRMESLKINK